VAVSVGVNRSLGDFFRQVPEAPDPSEKRTTKGSWACAPGGLFAVWLNAWRCKRSDLKFKDLSPRFSCRSAASPSGRRYLWGPRS
jgi:hypothetical protein